MSRPKGNLSGISHVEMVKDIARLCEMHNGKDTGKGLRNQQFLFAYEGGMTVELIGDDPRGVGFIAIRFTGNRTPRISGGQFNTYSGKWNIQSWPADLRPRDARAWMVTELQRRLEFVSGLPTGMATVRDSTTQQRQRMERRAEQQTLCFALCGEGA